MFNIGPVEILVVLVLSLIIFGPAKLPELMANVGHAIREFQRASRELTDVFHETQQEFSSALTIDLDSSVPAPNVGRGDRGVEASDAVDPPGYPAEDFPSPTSEITPIDIVPDSINETPLVEASREVRDSADPRADVSPAEYATAAAMLDEPDPIEDVVIDASPVNLAPAPAPRRRRAKSAATLGVVANNFDTEQALLPVLPTASAATVDQPGVTEEHIPSSNGHESGSPPPRSRRSRVAAASKSA